MLFARKTQRGPLKAMPASPGSFSVSLRDSQVILPHILQLISAGSVTQRRDVTTSTASASRSMAASLLKKSQALFSQDILSMFWQRSSIAHGSSMIWIVHSPTPPTRGEVVPEASSNREAILTASILSCSNCFMLFSMLIKSSLFLVKYYDRPYLREISG